MSTTIISATAGVVTKIEQVGTRWKVTVSYPGGSAVYLDLDQVMVGSCQVVTPGQVIGTQNDVQVVINQGLLWYQYKGNNTNTHTDSRLVGASEVLWVRAGSIKDGATNDGYAHNAVTGAVISTEVQNDFETFTVFYKPKV